MNDLTVEVNGLRLFARHGVGEQERKVGNLFEVTVHLRYPADGAIADDRLEDTLNYAEAVAVVREVMTVPSQLLEHVAGRLRTALTRRFPLIAGGMIRVAKLVPPFAADIDSVAVVLRW
ncbi:dihydroneopterin aldolase [Muribaculum intestinale]|uniref:dihydroneopterin aldolase n=1 Tax=Muribaculum intestinale TaxID=1796646 RepID=UPI000F49DC6B|nr:dihydroneopterin aldolase [Muribaculum intestinale]ROT11346.1 dihydroneopterin aldolase [Muribaculaceae bacterium Isolate-100 (HZI)]RXE67357.1 dihydroneopterin aldolase [Muribaculaceae bacterium Isolate-007 (NCI)]